MGGGVVRDVLLAQIPAVLRVDIYATAALAGSLVMVAGARIGVPRTTAAILGWRGLFHAAHARSLAELAAAEGWRLLTDRNRRYLTIAGSRDLAPCERRHHLLGEPLAAAPAPRTAARRPTG